MPVVAQSRLVSLVGAASLAAAQATLDAAVAAAVLAGFVPESIEALPSIPTSGGGCVNGLSLEGDAVSTWTGVTAADCVLLQCNGRANAAAIEAAIAAEIAAQDLAGVTPSLRQVRYFSLAISGAGRRLDVVALLFTDGVAAVMTAADKTKLDGIQKQGATDASAGVNVDWSAAGTRDITLAAGANALTFSNNASGMVVVVRVASDAGGSTLTFPAGIEWSGGNIPTQTPTGKDVYTFVQFGNVIVGTVLPDSKV